MNRDVKGQGCSILIAERNLSPAQFTWADELYLARHHRVNSPDDPLPMRYTGVFYALGLRDRSKGAQLEIPADLMREIALKVLAAELTGEAV